MSESNVETAPAVETPAVERNSPSAEVFCATWNASESRQAVVAALVLAGFTISYSAVVARAKQYAAKGVTLKDMPAAQRGRKLDVAALNNSIAEQAGANKVAE